MSRPNPHINMVDLNPADTAIRHGIGAAVEQLRLDTGWNRSELSIACGHRNNWFQGLFRTANWRLSTMQKICRVLGCKLTWTVDGGPVPVPPEDGAEALASLASHMGPEFEEEAERVGLQDLLRRTREGALLSRVEFGARLLVAPAVVAAWESGDEPEFLILTAQRYFRSLGAVLRFHIVGRDGVSWPVEPVPMSQVPLVPVTQSKRGITHPPRLTSAGLPLAAATYPTTASALSPQEAQAARRRVLHALDDIRLNLGRIWNLD